MATAAVPRKWAELRYRWTLNLFHLSVSSWVRVLSMDDDLAVVLIDQSAQVRRRWRARFFFLSSVRVNEFIINFICLRVQISLLFSCLMLLNLHFVLVIMRPLGLWGHNFNVIVRCLSSHCLSLLWNPLFEQLSTGDIILFMVSLTQPGTVSVVIVASVGFLGGVHSC